jgi:hypothetical protein
MASTIQPLAEAWIAFWREYEETGKFSTSNDAAAAEVSPEDVVGRGA